MKKSITPRLAVLFLLMVGSCRPGGDAIHSDDPGPESWPANSEVLAYLEGQSIPALKRRSDEFILRLVGIEALSVEAHGNFTAKGSWATNISFIYNTGRARFTIEAIVVHRLIDGRRTFSAFLLKQVRSI